MKNSLLLLVGAATLSLASCSQEKTTDTTTTTAAPADATATAMPDTAAYRTRSSRVSEKFISDMKITDPAMQAKVRAAYYNRSKRYGEMKGKYGSDTTGMATAMRQYNTDTDTEFQGVLTDQTQYQSYQSSRSTYDESNYMDDASSSSTMPADNSSSTSADNAGSASSSTDMSNGVGVKESKTKLEDGSKIKVGDDGVVKTKGDPNSGAALKDSKTKLEDGSKIKVKGDGTVKVKDADGIKTKL